MAILCMNCGMPLPKDDAKFCNNCGTLVPSHPFSSRSTASSPDSVQRPNGPLDHSRPPMREQIAHLSPSPARPTRRFTQDQAPTWMSHLDDSASNRPPSNNPMSNSGNSALSSTPPQLDFPVPEPMARPGSAVRELRVKVWQPEEPVSSPGLPTGEPDPVHDDDMDALPTMPLIASSTNALMQPQNAIPSQSSTPTRNDRLNELERMNTAQLATSTPPVQQPPAPLRKQFSYPGFDQSFAMPGQQNVASTRDAASAMPGRNETVAPVRPMAPSAPPRVARVTGEAQLKQTPPPLRAVPSPVAVIPSAKRRRPTVLIVGLLAILLIGATGIWIVVAQPFNVPAISQPQQSFTNSGLAFALQYPTGWVTQGNNAKTTVVFADSSNTAQFTVSVIAANGKDAGQSAQQMATQAKMTNIKTGATLSFGGATWQQVQGNRAISGANYRETIVATVHNNQLYTIIQDAPSSTYVQEEQLVFSAMRSSFKFL